MEDTKLPRTIHVSCGDTSLTEELSISRKDLVCLRDKLSCGPLGSLDDLESWRAMRQAYWDHTEGEPRNPRKQRRRPKYWIRNDLLGASDRLADATEVVIWLGTGLADQLAFAWMPQLLRALGVRPEILRVVQFERTSGGKPIPHLGILSRNEFRKHPAPHPIDGEELADLDRAWGAVTASDPAELIRFLDQVSSPLPRLRAALSKILRRYPDIRSGLNRYDAQLLMSTRDDGPVAARVIASSMRALYYEEDDCIGDIWLFWRLRRLADPTLPHPAVILLTFTHLK
jgi:Domain of unknown function (DUF1835)